MEKDKIEITIDNCNNILKGGIKYAKSGYYSI